MRVEDDFPSIPLVGLGDVLDVIQESKVSSEAPTESPVIVLPDERREQLQAKINEYRKRMADDDEFTHPEGQLLMGSGTAYNFCVLERLLSDGTVKTFDLSAELMEKLGDRFDPAKFGNACGVIKDYCETGGAKVTGGTGLPQINPAK